MLNLTPHAITIVAANGDRVTFPPSGKVARVETKEEFVSTCPVTGAPIYTRVMGKPVGLPENGEACLVSAMVLSALVPGTKGVFAPDSGATAIREGGQVVAVTRLITA